jgi:ribose/xylose/arabinose/galactoside ABC-type transport system permease subunit
VVLIALTVLVVCWQSPPQGVLQLLFNRLYRAVPFAMFAWAAAVLISCGIVDISAGALVSLLGMIVLFVANCGLSASVQSGMVLANIGIAMLLYLIAYYLIVNQGLNPLICTLAMGFCYRSTSKAIYSYVVKAEAESIGLQTAGASSPRMIATRDFPELLVDPRWVIAVAVIVLVSLVVWRYKTTAGLQHIAIGLNPVGARMAGVSEKRVYFVAFATAGALIALGTSYMIVMVDGGWVPGYGMGIELVAIAIAVLGGCSLNGGVFSPGEVALAAILWSLLQYQAFRVDFVFPEAEHLIMGLLLLMIPIFQKVFLRIAGKPALRA